MRWLRLPRAANVRNPPNFGARIRLISPKTSCRVRSWANGCASSSNASRLSRSERACQTTFATDAASNSAIAVTRWVRSKVDLEVVRGEDQSGRDLAGLSVVLDDEVDLLAEVRAALVVGEFEVDVARRVIGVDRLDQGDPIGVIAFVGTTFPTGATGEDAGQRTLPQERGDRVGTTGFFSEGIHSPFDESSPS